MSEVTGGRCPRGIVFDLDDTLYLERDYVRSGFEAVGRHLVERAGIEGAAEELWRGFERGVRGRAFDELIARHGLRRQIAVEELVACYRSHAPSIALLADAVEALGVARSGFTGLVTDGPAASQRAKIEALALDGAFDHIVVTGEYGPGFSKPHRRAFEEMERVSGLSGDALAYVADNPAKDFDAPRALGWRALRVRRPLGLYRERPGVAGVPEVPDLKGLSDWL